MQIFSKSQQEHPFSQKQVCLAHTLTGKNAFLMSFPTLVILRPSVFSPGSLRENFLTEYCKLCGNKKYLKKYYTFITYNANISEEVKNIDFHLRTAKENLIK